jgi:hypothetical protein
VSADRDQPHDSPPARLSGPASGLRRLASGALSAAKAVPVVGPALEFTESELGRAEDTLWRQVRHRMETVSPSDRTVVVSVDRPAQQPPARAVPHAPSTRTSGSTDDPGVLLTDLLTVSVEQSADAARQRLAVAVLRELQPDEARILAALSDGTRYAVLHVVTRLHLGVNGPPVLENASTVGRAAGVALPDMVPWYVGHLARLGLVTVGPESPDLRDTYDILETEPHVREAQEAASSTRLLRRSLRISPFGARLWDLCQSAALAADRSPGR